MSIFSSNNWHSEESRLIRFAEGTGAPRGPESFGGDRWPGGSQEERDVSASDARYQRKNAYGRWEVDQEAKNADIRDATMRRNGQEYIAKLQGAGARKTEILQRLKERHDATQGWVRKEYENLARGLNAAYAEKIKMIRENEWNRYTLVLGLEDVLKQYETKVTDHEEYLKTAGSIYYKRTKAALDAYGTSRKAVFGPEVKRELTEKVSQAEQALQKAKDEAARAGLGALEEREEDARKAWDGKDIDRVRVNAQVQELQTKVTEAETAGTDMLTEQGKLDVLKKDKTDTEKSVSEKKEELEGKVREAARAGLNPLGTHTSDDWIEKEWVRGRIAKIDPADLKKAEKIKQYTEEGDEWIKKVKEIYKLESDIKDLEKHVKDLDDSVKGSIKKQAAVVKALEAKSKTLPKLQTDLADKKKEEATLKKELAPLQKEYDDAKKAADTVRKPVTDAERALTIATVNRDKAVEGKRRVPSDKEKQEFVAQADATLRTINMEGFHLQNQFEGRTDGMNARIVFLRRQRTEILEDLVRERGLHADRDTVRALLDNIHFEKQYLLKYGHDDARLTHLNDLETEWAGKMWNIVKKETDDILSPARPGAPEEQERIIKQELKFLAEYPQGPAGAARIAILNSAEPAVPGELQKVRDALHKPLTLATDGSVEKARKSLTVPEIQDAIQKIRTEGSFLWQRGDRSSLRMQMLENDLPAMQVLLAEARVRDAETETAKGVGSGTHLERIAYVEKMQAELATRAETNFDPKRMKNLKTEIDAQEQIIQSQLLKQCANALASGNADTIRSTIDATVQAKRFFAADRTPESKNRAMTMVSQLQALRSALADVTDKACERVQTNVSKPTVKEAVRLTREEFQLLRKYSELEEGGYGSNRMRELRRMFNDVLIGLDNAIGIKDAKTLGAMNAPEAKRLLALIETDLEVRRAMVPAWRNNSGWEGKLMRMQAALEQKKS
ncbi:MAG: hypothetical protein PHN33_05570 [Candidatus Peribacteraceae bacterium]|nr:hypothetical protein [Candidatus Peribacteraceae bacterium]